MPVLDLGCGRGEWLELLGEHNLQARGLDSNEMMIEMCKAAGLEVTLDNALSYLGTLPDACMGAVTSFHMVEHMPFDAVLALVDEALRVLKPGGILILETPNPENLLVGTYTFHFDPTHLKPLPSPMLRFFVEARGFCHVQVRALHPYPETVRVPDDGKGVAGRLNDYLYGPQDYAVIGQKP
ncbi:MAG TPA: class I SAM-dependent methyltransferase [Bryobacteraceae bacterium]